MEQLEKKRERHERRKTVDFIKEESLRILCLS